MNEPSNELSVQSMQSAQKELIIAKQETEIMNLKFQLQKIQAEKVSRLEDSLFSPALFKHYEMVAEKLSKSSVIPKDYRGKPEDVFVAIAMGYQLGFPVEQSLQDIAVINGRPSVWGDGLLALALSHPECRGIKEEPLYEGGVVIGYRCTVTRKGHEPHSKEFTMKNAQLAGLLGKPGPWTQYPERMLQMRARVAIKDKFADALRGLKVVEIDEFEETVIEGEVIKEEPIRQTEKLKQLLSSKNSKESQTIPPKKEEIKEAVYTEEESKFVVEPKASNIPKDEANDEANLPASPDQIMEIQRLMKEKNFDDNRTKNAFNYFKVESLGQLTVKKAKLFLIQLGKS